MTEFIISLIYRFRIYIKFVTAGTLAILTEILVVFILTEFFGYYYVLSAGIAFAAGFTVSFIIQKFWTFQLSCRKKIVREILLYLLVAIIGTTINVKAVYFLVEEFRKYYHIGYDYIFIQALMGMVIGMANFVIYKFIIFRKKIVIIEPGISKRKILLATGIFPPDIGGPATYCQTLLNELPDMGFDIKIVTYADEVDNANPKVIQISRKQNILFRYIKYFLAVSRLADWADVVYLQGLVGEGLPGWLACSMQVKPYFLKIVGDYAWEQGSQRFGVKDLMEEFQTKKYNWRVETLRYVQRLVARAATKIIVPSFYLKTIVKQWGVNEEKIEVIYNSVDAIDLQLRKSEAKSLLGLSGDTIVTAGRLVSWKGFDTLIGLMPELLSANPNFNLLIMGEGPDREKLAGKIKKMKLEKAVKLLGKIEHSEAMKYLRAADIFILNTGYEGLSHVLIEAMQLGAPIIASRIGGNPEVVEDGETGILIEYNNREQIKAAIIKLWHNRALANSFSEKGVEEIKDKFTKTKMINNIVKLLD